eukprot:11742718-Alexandrium_andersonii.AAC.1
MPPRLPRLPTWPSAGCGPPSSSPRAAGVGHPGGCLWLSALSSGPRAGPAAPWPPQPPSEPSSAETALGGGRRRS